MFLLIQIPNKNVFIHTALSSMSPFVKVLEYPWDGKGRTNSHVYPHYWLFISNVIVP